MTLDKHAKSLRAASRSLATAASSDRTREAHQRELQTVFRIVLDALLELNGTAKTPKRTGR